MANASTTRRHACERCHKRKQKCDRKAPVCTMCEEAGTTCLQRTVESSEGSGTALVGEGYISSLKRSIDNLKALQSNKRPRTQSSATPGSPQTIGQAPRATNEEHHSVHNALADFGHFALNATPREQESENIAGPTPLSSAYIVQSGLAWLELKRPQAYESVSAYIEGNATFSRSSSVLSLETILQLLRVYVDQVLNVYPFIDPETLSGYFEEVFAAPAGARAATDYQKPERSSRSVLVYLALATTWSYNTQQVGQQLITGQCRARALKFCESIKDDDPLTTVQCLVAATLYAFHGSESGPAAALIGIAISRAVAWGFHRSNSGNERRLMKTLYVLDHTLSSVIGSPPNIQEHDISGQVLDEVSHGEAGERNSLLHELSEHCRLLSKLKRKKIYSSLFLTSAYQTWLETTTLRDTSSSDAQPWELFLRLKCRLLVAIWYHSRRHPGGRLPVLDNDELADTFDTSHEWLRCLQARHDEGTHLASVLDPYEIASVIAMSVDLSRHSNELVDSEAHMSIHMLGISLLSFLSASSATATVLRSAVAGLRSPGKAHTSLQGTQQASKLPRKIIEMLKLCSDP